VALTFGFALLLGAAMFLSGRALGWRSGLLWGLAGYFGVLCCPLSGSTTGSSRHRSGSTDDRQMWWLMTAFSTAAGLSFVVFGRSLAIRMLGVVCSSFRILSVRRRRNSMAAQRRRAGGFFHIRHRPHKSRALAFPWRLAGVLLQEDGVIAGAIDDRCLPADCGIACMTSLRALYWAA